MTTVNRKPILKCLCILSSKWFLETFNCWLVAFSVLESPSLVYNILANVLKSYPYSVITSDLFWIQ